MILFNESPYVASSIEYMRQACESHRISGDGPFTRKASEWLENRFGAKKVLLTTSCSHALDMMMVLYDIRPGDEVILPSYNFVSAGNSIAFRGGKCVFTDVRPDTMNIDEKQIEQAITDKTKAIMVMHYAGVSCDMDAIMDIAQRHGLAVMEDAAQGMMSTYKGRALGTMGLLGSFSFHETKNYSMGEGGCLIINDDDYIERAEILREKGTDRSKFWRGQVDKYTWQDIGSSYLPSEINAAYLWSQLEVADEINAARIAIWERYAAELGALASAGRIALPAIPPDAAHNGHLFYIKCTDLADRTAFIDYMKENDVLCTFHYIPLHGSPAGMRFGRFAGKDEYTTAESERLVRLPVYYGLSEDQQAYIIEKVKAYFGD